MAANHQGCISFLQSGSLFAGELRSGRVIGRASEGSCTLLFAGFFWNPLSGFGTSSPLDNPDAVASWLLKRYQTLGTGFLDGLPGNYGLAVLDSGDVHLASDPYGQRTLYISVEGGQLTFSSNLSTLGMLLGPRLVVDRSWEDFFLIYGFHPYGKTPFSGVTALPPGQVLTWSDGIVAATRTIAPISSGLPEGFGNASQDGALDAGVKVVYDGFMDALKEQSATAQEVGVLLGGFDSALVAAGLRRLGKKVSTWSFHYEDAHYNQPHTEELALFLDARHEWVHITEQTLRDGLDRFAHVFNQPTNWPNYVIQTVAVCERMKEAGLHVAYSGDGCDTVFLGYPGTWRRSQVLQKIPSMPKGCSRMLASLLAQPFIERHIGHPWRVLLNLVRTSSWQAQARGYLSFRILDEVSLRQLRAGEAPPQDQDLQFAVEALAAPHRDLSPLRLAYLGKARVSPNRNKMSGSADVSGLPILSPYLHPGFKHLAQNLPLEFLRPGKNTASRITGKYILMKMAENKRLLPASVIYQEKMAAVDAPVDAWYAGPMREFMLEKMRGLPFESNQKYLESLLTPHIAEQLFQRYLLTDKVIKHAPSLLVTYASFCDLVTSVTDRANKGDMSMAPR